VCCSESEYRFLLKMFNKRNISDISMPQDRKIKALIMNAIMPWMR